MTDTNVMNPASAVSVSGEEVQEQPEVREVFSTIRELAWVVHRSAPERAGVGPLPTTEIALLKQVIDVPGSTVGELAGALGLWQPNVSSALRVLEQRGLITREKDEGDKRVTHIMATEHGVTEHEAISEAWKAPLLNAFARLEPGQQERIMAVAPELHALYEFMLEDL